MKCAASRAAPPTADRFVDAGTAGQVQQRASGGGVQVGSPGGGDGGEDGVAEQVVRYPGRPVLVGHDHPGAHGLVQQVDDRVMRKFADLSNHLDVHVEPAAGDHGEQIRAGR